MSESDNSENSELFSPQPSDVDDSERLEGGVDSKYDQSPSESSSLRDLRPSFRPRTRMARDVLLPSSSLGVAAATFHLHHLGGIGGDLVRQTRELGAMQLACERQLSRVRTRAREQAHEARVTIRQLRAALQQRVEQLDIFKVDLATVVQRLEESEEYARGLNASLQQCVSEAQHLRQLVAERDRQISLSTAEAELRSARESNERERERHTQAADALLRDELTEALAERDRALGLVEDVRERKREVGTRYLLLALRSRMASGFGRWAFATRLISGEATAADVAQLEGRAFDAARERDEAMRAHQSAEQSRAEMALAVSRMAGITRVSISQSRRLAFGGGDAEARLALLHWARRTTASARALEGWRLLGVKLVQGGSRSGRVELQKDRWARHMRRWMGRERGLQLTGEGALRMLLAHWRLLTQGRGLSAQCKALDAQTQYLTSAHAGEWWTAGSED